MGRPAVHTLPQKLTVLACPATNVSFVTLGTLLNVFILNFLIKEKSCAAYLTDYCEE